MKISILIIAYNEEKNNMEVLARGRKEILAEKILKEYFKKA